MRRIREPQDETRCFPRLHLLTQAVTHTYRDNRATADNFVRAIKALGKTPVQRDTLYRDVRIWN